MLTKDVLDEIIRRRYDEGKTLSIEHIDGERYSNWKIRDAARKFYGGWADARNEVVGVSRSEEHTSELQSRGHLVCRLLLEKKKDKNQYQYFRLLCYQRNISFTYK